MNDTAQEELLLQQLQEVEKIAEHIHDIDIKNRELTKQIDGEMDSNPLAAFEDSLQSFGLMMSANSPAVALESAMRKADATADKLDLDAIKEPLASQIAACMQTIEGYIAGLHH